MTRAAAGTASAGLSGLFTGASRAWSFLPVMRLPLFDAGRANDNVDLAKARKNIANFKLRQGHPVGCFVTLRRDMMYEFFDRLISATLPRIRDFRGLSPRKFDGRGNYSLGIGEQTVFPEIELDKIKRTQGMDITIVTSAESNDEAKDLLQMMGFPFSEK